MEFSHNFLCLIMKNKRLISFSKFFNPWSMCHKQLLCILWGLSVWPFIQLSKFSLCLLMLPVKKCHYNFSISNVFESPSWYQGSIPGWVIPKTLKMVLDTSLLNIQHYKVHIKGKVEQSREKSSTLSYASV